MKNILIGLFLVLTININAQIPDLQYNPIDTAFTFSRAHIQAVKNEIEYLTKDRNLLDSLHTDTKKIIKKLVVRDSLFQREIDWYKQLDKTLQAVDERQNEIIRNQSVIIISTESRLKVETKKAKRAELWKDVYKYGWPIVAIITAFVIAK